MTSRQVDERTGCRVFFKCENFQRVGAFKFRGAYNAISQLTRRPEEDVACSPTPPATTPRRWRSRPSLLGTTARDRDAAGCAAGQARGHPRLRRRGRHLRQAHHRARGAGGADRAGTGPDAHPAVRSSARRRRAGHGREGADRGRRAARLPVRVRGRRRVDLRLRARRRMRCRPAAGSSAWSRRPATTRPARSRPRRCRQVHNPDTIADGARTPSLGEITFPLVLQLRTRHGYGERSRAAGAPCSTSGSA